MIDGLSELEIKDKKVLVRLDLNVPVYEGEILSDFRINKSIPTIINLLKNCLLYTSPSPRDGLLSRMPSSA